MTRTILPIALAVLVAVPAEAQRGRTSTIRTSPAAYAQAEKQKGTSATIVARNLVRSYRQSTDRIGGLLLGAGYRPPQVLHALLANRVSVNLAVKQLEHAGRDADDPLAEAQESVETLLAAGHDIEFIMQVIVLVYDLEVAEAVQVLRGAGLDATATAAAVAQYMEPDLDTLADALTGSGYSCTSVFAALRANGEDDPRVLVAAVASPSCSEQDLISALAAAYDCGELAGWLFGLIYEEITS